MNMEKTTSLYKDDWKWIVSYDSESISSCLPERVFACGCIHRFFTLMLWENFAIIKKALKSSDEKRMYRNTTDFVQIVCYYKTGHIQE